MSNAGASSEAQKLHTSNLADPRQRFLSRVVAHTLADGWRTPEDFLRHFTPADIVASLADANDLRVKLLVATTGTHEKIALKKSVGSATEDLELALAEQTTTSAALVALYPADDKVRHLDAKRLWAFVVEDEFFRTKASEATRHTRAAARLSFIVECALSEGLLTLRDVADGLTFDVIAAALPVADVRKVAKHALGIARASAPLSEDRFLSVVPLPALLSYVDLSHSWQHVVVERVATPAGFVEAAAAPAPSPAAVVDAHVAAAPAAAAQEEPGLPPSPSEVDVSVTVESPVGGDAADAAPAAAGADGARPADDEDEVHRRVIERLKLIDRLPPSHAELSTALLLSVESMYANLWAVNDDDEREACIRESFPNQTHLRTAMLALIELLDPSVDTQDPIIRDADVSGLIKIVLFEERRRRDATPSSSRKTAASNSAARARRSVPPPLPRSSTPPPLPMSESSGRGSSPPPLPAEAGKRDA